MNSKTIFRIGIQFNKNKHLKVYKFVKRKMVQWKKLSLLSFKQMKKHYQQFHVQILMDKTKLQYDSYLFAML